MNEIHDAQQRHSPSRAMQHIATQGDKQDKNRYADGRNVGGLMVVTHYIYIVACHSERGLSAKLGLLPDISGVFILFLFNTD